MPAIPSGNISLLELIDLAFEQKYGNATVDPLEVDEALVASQWEATRDAVWKAFKAHDIMLYVESRDGTEKRLTDQQSDEWQSDKWPVGRTLLTGKLEHETDPAVFQRTVYVRDDDASTFLKEFTGRGLDRPRRQPDTTTSGVNSKVGGKAKRTFLKTNIDADYTAWVKEQTTRTGRPPTFEADVEWRKGKELTYKRLRKLRKQHRTEKEKEGGRPPRS